LNKKKLLERNKQNDWTHITTMTYTTPISLILLLFLILAVTSSAFTHFALPAYKRVSSTSIAYKEHDDGTDLIQAKRFNRLRVEGEFEDDTERFDKSFMCNRDYRSTRYVKARRAATVSADEDVTQEMLRSVEEKNTEKRRLAWINARKEEEHLDM